MSCTLPIVLTIVGTWLWLRVVWPWLARLVGRVLVRCLGDL